MDKAQLKRRIAELLHAGQSLAEIQNSLRQEGQTLTFLDLRLLAAEVEDVDWGESAADAAAAAPDPDEILTGEVDADPGSPARGRTVVELSRIARPGAALHGSVRFASGATADWVVDAYGRLALQNAQGQPTPEDLEDFQDELQRKLSGGAGA